MKTFTLITLIALGIAATVSVADPVSPAREQYQVLASLHGDWVLSPSDKQEGKTKTDKVVAPMLGTGKVGMSFKVIGKGSTVQENLLPGTGKEMATMYHCNDIRKCPQLVATHYCAKQNQPQLVAKPANDQGKVILSCDMSTALCNSNDEHVHLITHELSDSGKHLKTIYTIFRDGKKKGDTIYHFERKT